MKFFLTILMLVVWVSSTGIAQQISGRVKDKRTGEALQFANVFLNHTSIGAATDGEGNYRFVFPAGSYELKISYVGYETETRVLTATEGESVDFDVSLIPSKSPLSEIEVSGSRDKKWARTYRKFEKEFLGTTANARKCTITNPWIVDFDDEGGDWQVKATAAAPVEIVNNALGYKVHFYIKLFEIRNDKTIILGDVKYDTLTAANDAERKTFIRNREHAYMGSERHLFKALVSGHPEREGFALYAETKQNKFVSRTPIFRNELGKTVIPYKLTVIPSPGRNRIYKIPLDTRIEVHYQEPDPTPFYQDTSDQVSWIEGTGAPVQANEMGIIQDPSTLLTLGYLRTLRVADMLPLDYRRGK